MVLLRLYSAIVGALRCVLIETIDSKKHIGCGDTPVP